MKEKTKQIIQAVSIEPVNIKNKMVLKPTYYSQEETEIKEEYLVPSTDEEKEAEKAINNVKNMFIGNEFSKLVDDGYKLKNEYDQLESSFYDVYIALKNKVGSKIKNGRTNSWSGYLRQNIRSNKIERHKLIQLINQLNEKRADVDELRNKLEIGIDERIFAKCFFEQAQEALKKAIIERLKNKSIKLYPKRNNLAKEAQNKVKNALDQLETSSSKISEAIGRKKEIEKLIQEARSILE
ncbi:P12 family lipoprotein [Borreliella japonica]|uniref:P12 family lipoprotein n=1 Tax=Borreliella japonica TaxID=34095 RepID=UPI0026494A36|nr:P12 family lipoprotein [Borreliella japonica]WKC87627.1 P12 family lipoprotein [Borreliella japonica]